MGTPPAAKPEAIRRANLGLILAHVHHDGALTRAELTARLGVSRSTVGALVADLSELGIVDERVPSGGERAGRPSHVVAPAENGPHVLAIDVGVNRVTTAAVTLGGTVLGRVTAELPPDRRPSELADILRRSIKELDVRSRLVGVGVSVPGTVNRRSQTVEFAPNLDWRRTQLRDVLASVLPTGVNLMIGNDADLAMRAEHVRGAARGCEDAIYLLGRVGLGAGIMVNGQPLRGRDGFAGEVGHNVMDPAGPPCHCGQRGCLETYVGEPAIAAGSQSGGDTVAAFAAARAGRPRALAAVAAAAHQLGRATAELVNIFNPERVILGGSLAEVLAVAGDRFSAAIESAAFGGGAILPECRAGALHDSDATLLGAAELVFAEIIADPVATLA